MSMKLKAYDFLEGAFGRRAMWKLGRWLYQGSRRELKNDPVTNGEYALHRWLADAWARRGVTHKVVVCDVGANLGDWTANALPILRQTLGGNLLIHAFEPAPPQYRAFCERLASEISEGTVVADAR